MEANRTAEPNRPKGGSPRTESTSDPKRSRSFGDRIVGGLIIAAPLMLTLWIIVWLYSVLEKKVIDPLAGFILWKLRWTTSSTDLPYWFETFAAPVIAIVVAIAMLYLLDYFADTGLHRGVTWTLKRVPFFSHIYNPIQQIFQSLEQGQNQQISQRMVLIPFPHPGIKLPAFVTGSCRDVDTQRVVLCVYVPTTPVPTSGFFLLVPEEEVTELNWNTEQTLQAVMSGGLASPAEVSYFSLKSQPSRNAPTAPDGTSNDSNNH
jgi:uncharacterized membrane protein